MLSTISTYSQNFCMLFVQSLSAGKASYGQKRIRQSHPLPTT